MNIAKTATLLAWIISAACFLLAGDQILVMIGRGIFGLLVVIHAIECLVFLPRLKALPGALAGHLFNTFIYGVFHPKQEEAKLADQAGQSPA